MSRALVAVCLLLVLVLGLCLLSVWYMVDSSQRLLSLLPPLLAALEQEQWQQSARLYSACEHEFARVKTGWELMINHDDMRDIEVALVDLGSAITAQDAQEARKELNDLRFFISHVPDTERPDWGNIL